MTKRQRIFFRIGAWGCIVMAGIHVIGFFAPPGPPANDTEATLQRLLTTYQKDFGAGFSRTTMDFLKGFSLSFALLLLWVGVLDVLAFRRAAADGGGISRLALWNAILAAGLVSICLKWFFLPPLVCVMVLCLSFAVAALPASGPPGRAV